MKANMTLQSLFAVLWLVVGTSAAADDPNDSLEAANESFL